VKESICERLLSIHISIVFIKTAIFIFGTFFALIYTYIYIFLFSQKTFMEPPVLLFIILESKGNFATPEYDFSKKKYIFNSYDKYSY
jgi:hypothetical protein